MAKQIRLTEAQLTEMVNKCAEVILNEGAFWDALKGTAQGLRDVNRANRQDRRAAKDAQKAATQQQKEFDNYMKMAENDIQAIQQILSHYQGQPNSGNIVDKANRLIGAIRPKNGAKADNRSYYSGMQGKLNQAQQKAADAAETAQANKQQRSQNIQQGMRQAFSGKQQPQQQQYAQASE